MFDIKSNNDGRLSPESISFIQERLAIYLVGGPGHSSCRPNPNFTIDYPQRMLKITAEQVFLVDFDSSNIANFAALSYCWGDKHTLELKPPLRLTAATLHNIRSGVQISELPLTLKQAIDICGYLDLEYIWIDALCIIQDNPSDWAREAKKMATVYATSAVTIIAASSTSCHSGFLTTTRNLFIVNTPPHPPLRLVAQPGRLSGFYSEIHITSDHIDKRGWTLQEELLSTRYIKFTEDDVQWMCGSGTECICGQPTARDKLRPFLTTEYEEIQRQPREEWLSIAAGLANRHFSVATDKLQALSGLARMNESEMQSIYVAGIWKSHMQPEPNSTSTRTALAWKVKDIGRCYEAYVAPSFSWASLDSSIFLYDNVPARSVCDIITVGTTPTSPSDPFGRVSDGFLTISGPVLPCVISGSGEDRLTYHVGIEWDLEATFLYCSLDCPVRRILLDDDEHTLHRHPHGETKFESTAAHVIVLYLGSSTMMGLVLGREPGRGCYQRIAFVHAKLTNAAVTQLNKLERHHRQEITIR
ncbi:heterokaryon incompatibility protein-domain-containing protein [Lasiosphaeria ovina]|uniref:Heterokaryon incompatibility protein-domain-containing protein n=1 Tax=Lasiosphaeria ovina TaxID=92902 RepID=A0AAE0JWJ3_9PEZI|nr:heterokaryon incompatibility protein-domain-containing protein [Lasiosphaeria ovina]